MIATIYNKDGILKIIPETEIEQYALQKWIKENDGEFSADCKLEIENIFI